MIDQNFYRPLGTVGNTSIHYIITYLSFFTHRDIASAIKEVLDAVNELSQKHQDLPKMVEWKKVNDTSNLV